mmetsp:Transcript_27077/g.57391  ORF Transcript_27077/g.57391 Transcript_27077/m.57391 type:complete len:386 (+) Transcript_27077:114-1271(+)
MTITKQSTKMNNNNNFDFSNLDDHPLLRVCVKQAFKNSINQKSNLSVPKAFKFNYNSCSTPHEHNLSLRSLNSNLPSSPTFLTRAKVGLISNPPELCEEGTGGTYFLKDSKNQNVAVFKPQNEDPLSVQNPKRTSSNSNFHFKGILPGEGSQREVFAYLIDNGFAGVPETRMAEICHWIFTNENGLPGDRSSNIQSKIGSVQEFQTNIQCSVDDMGAGLFSVLDVQKIAILDMLIFNCDRNGGNILVTKDSHKLIPIDHAFSLPDYKHLTDLQWFEWLTWRQVKKPVLQEIKDFINNLDMDSIISTATALKFRQECIFTLKLCYTFIKTALEHSKTLHEIGKLMCSTDSTHPSTFTQLVTTASEGIEDTSEIFNNFKQLVTSFFQ